MNSELKNMLDVMQKVIHRLFAEEKKEEAVTVIRAYLILWEIYNND